VLEGAADGDGSHARPFASLAEAVSAVAEGGTVAVGAGTYAEAVVLRRDVTLVGACAGRVRVEPRRAANPEAAAITIRAGARVELRGIGIGGSRVGVDIRDDGTEAVLSGLWLHEATRHGVRVARGAATVEGCLVERTRLSSSGELGHGLLAEDGARVRLSRSVFEANGEAHVFATGDRGRPPFVQVEDTLMRAATGLSDGLYGWGLVAHAGARVTARRVILEDNRMAALVALAEGAEATTELDVEDVVVRDTLPQGSGLSGFGLAAISTDGTPVRVRAARGLFERNAEAGLYARGAQGRKGVELDVEDLIVRDTRAERVGGRGYGVWIQPGVHARLVRLIVERSRRAAVVVDGEGGVDGPEVTAADLIVHGTAAGVPGGAGHGLVAFDGAGVLLERGLLYDNLSVAAGAFGKGRRRGVLRATDVVARGIPCSAGRCTSSGIAVTHEALVQIERGVVERVGAVGVYVSAGPGEAGARLEATDLLVRDAPPAEEPNVGFGLLVGPGASAELSRLVIGGARDIGIWVGAGPAEEGIPPAEATLTDVVIAETAVASDGLAGIGLLASDDAGVLLERGVLRGNHMAGVFVVSDATEQPTTASLVDVAVLDTRTDADGTNGFGLDVFLAGRAAVERGLFAGNQATSVVAGGMGGGEKGLLELRDVTIRDTACLPNGRKGFGLGVQFGSQVVAQDLLVEGSHGAGVMVVGAAADGTGARFDATGIEVRDTASADCGLLPEDDPGSCVEGGRSLGAGHGVCALEDGTISLERFLVRRSAVAGLVVGPGGRANLRDGALTDNGTGGTILADDQPTADLTEDVHCYGNVTDWSRGTLALPSPLKLVSRMREAPTL